MVNVDISRLLCINIKERTDRLKRIRALSKRENIDIKFIRSDKNNKSSEKGKIQSHLAIIKTAKEKNISYVCIIEDDIKVLNNEILNKKKVMDVPEDWDILYLGGYTLEILKYDIKWSKARVAASFAYIIKDTTYDFIIKYLEKYGKSITDFNIDLLHRRYNAYIQMDPTFCQRDDYSDVQNMYVKHSLYIQDLHKEYCQLDIVKSLNNFNDSKLPIVTMVSEITNTSSTKDIELLKYNYYNLDYPEDKLKWLVIDNSSTNNLRSHIPVKQDLNIMYVKNSTLDEEIGNLNGYICYLNYKEYYGPDSIKKRIFGLLTYNKNCIGCKEMRYNEEVENIRLVDNRNLYDSTIMYSVKFYKPYKNIKSLIYNREDEVIMIKNDNIVTRITGESDIYPERVNEIIGYSDIENVDANLLPKLY